jgi:hypothetical protein
MSKTKFKAPLEHSLIGVALVLVWLGPALKLVGVLTCSWWRAFLVHEVIWTVTVLAFLAYTLVGDGDLVGEEPQPAYAD